MKLNNKVESIKSRSQKPTKKGKGSVLRTKLDTIDEHEISEEDITFAKRPDQMHISKTSKQDQAGTARGLDEDVIKDHQEENEKGRRRHRGRWDKRKPRSRRQDPMDKEDEIELATIENDSNAVSIGPTSFENVLQSSYSHQKDKKSKKSRK